MKAYDVCYPGQISQQRLKPQPCENQRDMNPAMIFNKREVWPSKMFTIKLELDEFTRNNPDLPVYDASQGDGGMSLGGIPKQELAQALINFLPEARSTKYGEPNGSIAVRRAIFDNYYQFDSESDLTPEHIVICDGGRDALQKWYQAINQDSGRSGDFILVSAAPWGSYPEGSYINGYNMLCAPGMPDIGFKITPEAIDMSLAFARQNNRKILGIIITTPDNPTGNYLNVEEVVKLIEYSTMRGIDHIFVDLIYQAVTDLEIGCYDVNEIYKSLSKDAQQRVCFMDGLTKMAGASNLRNAHLVCGSISIARKIKGIATHTVLPNAIGEAAAFEIYKQKDPLQHPWVRKVIVPTAESRKIVKTRLRQLGFKFICDQGYYAFINIFPWLGKRIPKGRELKNGNGELINQITDVEVLKSYLANKCGLAIIHGSVFRQPHFIRFSYANAPDYTNASITRLYESLKELE